MLLCSFALIAATPKRTSNPAPVPFNFELVVDSATILADDYAEAMVNKPEMVKSRMNALKRFYAPYSGNKTVADSICNVIFNMYVDNIERDNINRANAFKECFTEIADKDNEHYGPLYATELELAQERFDTTAVARYIPALYEYSARLDFDYDDVLSDAKIFLNNIRNRRPLRDALPGIWVSEDIAGVNTDKGKKDSHEGKNNWLNDCKIIQIRDCTNPIYASFNIPKDSITGLNIIRRSASAQKSYGPDIDWCIIGDWEQPAFNIQTEQQYEIPQISFSSIDNAQAKIIVLDNNCYSAYAFWGDESLKRNNAEIGSIIRQTTQNMQAVTSGHLSRNKYSNTERFAGNMASGLVGVGINSLVDAIMVSSDMIWSIEITFHMINPYCLEAELRSNTVVVKSNSTEEKINTYTHKAKYYRWEPEDNVVWVGAENNIGNAFTEEKPWITTGMIFLTPPSNELMNSAKKHKISFEKEFKIWYKNEQKKLKNQLKELDKNSLVYENLKNDIKLFNKFESAPKAWQQWNTIQLAKLKAKSDNYKP
mgnify:FL=1